jgi:hypothetical protein
MGVTINTSYAGEVLDQALVLATTKNEIVERGLVHIVPNVHDTFSITRARLGEVLQGRKPMPTAADAKGGFVYTERQLKPKDIMAYERFNPRDFEHTWRPFQPTGDLLFGQLPAQVQQQMLELFLTTFQQRFGERLINGKFVDGSAIDLFEGFVNRMANDTDKIAATTTETVPTKVLTALFKAIPKTLRHNPALKILMSIEDFDDYDTELTQRTCKGVDYSTMSPERFKNIPMIPLTFWPKGLLVATPASVGRESNLWMAVNHVSDGATLKVDLVQNDGELYFFKLLAKVDTQIAQGEEVVWLDKRPSAEPASAPANAA